MSAADDAILHDALRAAGYERITAWHLRCVEDYLTTRALMVGAISRGRNRWDDTHERLGYDLNNDIDELHDMARQDDTERSARISIAADLALGHSVHCAHRRAYGDGACECLMDPDITRAR